VTKGRTRTEELWNSGTHALGLVVFLPLAFSLPKIETKIVCYSMCIVYALSTLYHYERETKRKDIFRMLDMVSIHIAIGATSVAYCLTVGASFLFSALPVLTAAIGCQYVTMYYGEPSFVKNSLFVSVAVGITNLCIVTYVSSGAGEIAFFLTGCFVYLVGIYFYINDKKKYFHTIWHLIVLLASSIHVLGTIYVYGRI
jgi:hemolysin III